MPSAEALEAPMSRAPARVLALRAVFTTVGSVAPGIAARWAETIFCTPPRHEPRTGDEAFLAIRPSLYGAGRRAGAGGLGVGRRARPWCWCTDGAAAPAGSSADPGTRARAVSGSSPTTRRRTAAPPGASSRCPSSRARSARWATRSAPVHGLVGHSLGGAAATLALRDGLARGADRAARFPGRRHPLLDRLRGPPPASGRHPACRCGGTSRPGSRSAGTSCTCRPSRARSRTAALLVHDRGDDDIPYAPGRGDRRGVARRAARRHGPGSATAGCCATRASCGEMVAFLGGAGGR